MHEIFTTIFNQNSWGCPETVSGYGSTLNSTKTIAAALPFIIQDYHITTFLDAACGDFNWMQHLDLDIDHYTGVDVVPEIIQLNTERHSTAQRTFLVRNIATDTLPKADLIFCRDCLVHHTLEDVKSILRNFVLSGSTYILMTSFPEHSINTDITTGDWRPLNFQAPPFNFTSPLLTINEETAVDKSLALWSLAAISPYLF